MKPVLSIVLAGGQGERLRPLTDERAKPAVPFGGHYRIIDFVLSNIVNSGLFRILVLTQFKADSLLRHLKRGWHLPALLDHFIDAVPAQMRVGKHWYKGSADAVFQNLHHIFNSGPENVCIFGGDHIYRMNCLHFIEFHESTDADVTIAVIPQPTKEARSFGVISCDSSWRVTDFKEKPKEPEAMPGNSKMSLCSMGIYIFKVETLIDAVRRDSDDDGSAHDFGKDIIPSLLKKKMKIMAYNFAENPVPGANPQERGYWRDIGTIDGYWKASMDLVSVSPIFNLYNRAWSIKTARESDPPAKFVFSDEKSDRIGMATDSLVCDGVIISGGKIDRSILSPCVRVNSFSQIEESILFDHVNVGRYAKIRRAIIDKDVVISPHATIGYDLEKDRKKFTVSPEGIVVIPKGATV